MSHIPNISYREALGLGNISTLGRNDAAAPDNPLLAFRSAASNNRCTPINPPSAGALNYYLHSDADDARQLLLNNLRGGLALQGAQGYRLPPVAGAPARITQQNFVDAAASLNCEIAAVKAVAEVEARGSGFLADGRPKILFEAAYFSRFTERLYDKLYPNISSPKWKKELYLGGSKEYDRLIEALALNAQAALKSASWGAFQIMGAYHDMAGFSSVEDMVAAMYKNEGEHLKACVSYIKKKKLAKALQQKDWVAFAKGYNGEGYKDNDYDGKLAKAYTKHAAPSPQSNLPKPKL